MRKMIRTPWSAKRATTTTLQPPTPASPATPAAAVKQVGATVVAAVRRRKQDLPGALVPASLSPAKRRRAASYAADHDHKQRTPGRSFLSPAAYLAKKVSRRCAGFSPKLGASFGSEAVSSPSSSSGFASTITTSASSRSFERPSTSTSLRSVESHQTFHSLPSCAYFSEFEQRQGRRRNIPSPLM